MNFALHCSEYFVDWPKIRENMTISASLGVLQN